MGVPAFLYRSVEGAPGTGKTPTAARVNFGVWCVGPAWPKGTLCRLRGRTFQTASRADAEDFAACAMRRYPDHVYEVRELRELALVGARGKRTRRRLVTAAVRAWDSEALRALQRPVE